MKKLLLTLLTLLLACSAGETDTSFTGTSSQTTCSCPPGEQGDQGEPGPTGEQGEPGMAGPVGNQGDQGLAGTQGQPGATGAQGPMGSTGAQGPTGNQGPQGLPGGTGAQGPAGPAGAPGMLDFGKFYEVTTGGAYPAGNHTLLANCDPGDVAISGGCHAYGNTTINMRSNMPESNVVDPPTGWYCAAYLGSNVVSFYAKAICYDATP